MPALKSKHVQLIVTLVTFGIFLSAIFFVTLHLRTAIRQQILNREAESLDSVALMLESEQNDDLGAGALKDPAAQLGVVLKASRLKGVIGARLFDAEGKFVTSFPANVTDATLTPKALAILKQLQPVTSFRPSVQLETLFWKGGEKQIIPLLQITIPLHIQHASFIGAAQFIIDGSVVANEFAAVDRNLLLQATVTCGVGGILVFSALLWAFRRLQRAYDQLQQRSASLLEANQELALVSRTSAAGVVSIHLLHELKSQLFGIEAVLAGNASTDPGLQSVARAISTMRSLTDKVLKIVRDEEGTTTSYEIALDEMAESIQEKVDEITREAGVDFKIAVAAEGTLTSRVANLVMIILLHLIQNAVQASPRRGVVQLKITSGNNEIVCEVNDQGKGLPEHVRQNLFKPARSQKQGGTGIGLALCKQLANHLNAQLELVNTGRDGTTFVLRLSPKLVKDDY